ncbi:MAG: Flp pilus assembly complex ATPase component TadA, partial [Acidobacteriota bacterium]|nr:Flp pilus assembly complex ATPase component TadA [Acidobacteriota bacterium]
REQRPCNDIIVATTSVGTNYRPPAQRNAMPAAGRGAEALDMLQAMNTGVEGSMSTVHANTPRDAFARLETMVMMADIEIPARVILQQLASAIKLVVQVARLQDGARRIMSIAEVVGAHEDQVELQEIFTFERAGVTEQGKVKGLFTSTGVRPKLLERLRVNGINLPDSVFSETVPVNM